MESEEADITRIPRRHGSGFASLFGAWRGRVKIAEDFDELPEDLVESLGIRRDPPARQSATDHRSQN